MRTPPHLKGHLMLDMQQTRFQDDNLIVWVNHSLRSRRLEVVGERENGRTRGVSPSRAPVFSCAHYFQAPTTQARSIQLFHPHWPWKCIFVKNKSNITPWWSRLKHRETDSCSLRKQPAFGDATTDFPATWRLMNERPQPSMEFLRSFLRRHFAGKPGGVAKCWPDCWLLYCMSQSGRMLLQVSSMDPSLRASALGHFRVPKTLTFKVRPSAEHFLWKSVLFAWGRKIISFNKWI